MKARVFLMVVMVLAVGCSKTRILPPVDQADRAEAHQQYEATEVRLNEKERKKFADRLYILDQRSEDKPRWDEGMHIEKFEDSYSSVLHDLRKYVPIKERSFSGT
jgi:hypothetical protein